eukprot:TRINITY_DN1844_c0_g1_i1.p1 TRINITY_DN1844_c0_g1~~TRINITY_DN1844_c0_g1_i1.p1  ORF type:complete len:167 (-),score=11.14 TRINITY_DN1844_c0_g1_i1:203-703(-)
MIGLQHVLAKDDLRFMFESFVKSICCEEYLEMWKQIRMYKELQEESRKILAQQIWMGFLSTEATTYISFPTTIVLEVRRNLHSGSESLFDRIHALVWQLLDNDVLIKFLNSRMYHRYSTKGDTQLALEPDGWRRWEPNVKPTMFKYCSIPFVKTISTTRHMNYLPI